MSSLPMQAPSPIGKRDARAYCAQLCEWKKRNETGFSYRKLSKLAGFASPGYIKTFIDGSRNLRNHSIDRLTEALQLQGHAADYFRVLVAFTQTDDPDERLKHYESMLQISTASGTSQLDSARLSYFTQWYVPVVHAMASLRQFNCDPTWIAARTVPPIQPEQAQHALDLLLDLGIFAYDTESETKAIVVKEQRLETNEKVKGLWVREYHRAMIRLAERSIELLDRKERLLNGFSVTVPRSLEQEFRTTIEDQMKNLFYQMLAKQESIEHTDESDVFQFNMQWFRVTRTRS